MTEVEIFVVAQNSMDITQLHVPQHVQDINILLYKMVDGAPVIIRMRHQAVPIGYVQIMNVEVLGDKEVHGETQYFQISMYSFKMVEAALNEGCVLFVMKWSVQKHIRIWEAIHKVLTKVQLLTLHLNVLKDVTELL